MLLPNFNVSIEQVPNTVAASELGYVDRILDKHYVEYGIEPFSNTSTTENWGLENIRAYDAWRITTGSPYIKVGIMDSGIDGTHPSLRGLIHDRYHMDFVTRQPQDPLIDTNGHGTNVAGLIGSQNNGKTGVAQNVRLVSLRVLDNGGFLHSWDYWEMAIRHANSKGIHILNLSAGFNNDKPGNDDIERAIREFDGLFVTSAGNENRNNDNNPNRFPSNLRLPNLISVGASDENDQRVHFTNFWNNVNDVTASNYGRRTVCIFAPGISTLTTQTGGGYRNTTGWNNFWGNPFWGTSLAAPHVAGVAALMLSVNPDLSGQMLRDIIMFTANQNVGSCIRNGSVSRGIVDAYMAVRMVPPVGCPDGLFFVRNFADLLEMHDHPNGTFILKNNIYFAELQWLGIRQWEPILHFAGTLDGNGFSMWGLNIVVPNTAFTTVADFGLFRVLSGTVRNLNIVFTNIDGGTRHSGSWVHVGIIACVANGALIENVRIDNSNIFIDRQGSSVGGFVGRANGTTIRNSRLFAIALTGRGYLGGIIGHADRSTVYRVDGDWVWIDHRTYRNNRSVGGLVG